MPLPDLDDAHGLRSRARGGATKRISAVRWGLAANLVTAWVLTIPAPAGVAAAFYWPIQGVF